MSRILELLYLMLPVYMANMAPPFTKYWPWWNRPINEKRLGAHKTVVGFAFGIAAGIVTAFIQARIDWQGAAIRYVQWPAIGVACGLGAMVGDSAKSFIKRRLAIAPGQAWFPSDQLDFVIGGLIALSLWIDFSWLDVAWVIGLSLIGDVLVNQVSFRLGIRDTRW